jgi:hypothetical protein
MEEEAVQPHEQMDEVLEQVQEAPEQETHENNESHSEKTMIPLSVAQKLREKKKELELELQWERQEKQRLQQMSMQYQQKPVEEDTSRYESATREDLSKSQNEIVRIVEEKQWIKNNPEKFERVQELLPKFLKQRPNLASAISEAVNRYEEAYILMEALTPKQQQQISKPVIPKREAPNSPGGVPKAAAMNEAIDVMNMSDSEFSAWRNSKKRR